MTIARLLLRSAQLWGEKPALIDELRDRSISFSQMADAAFFSDRSFGGLALPLGIGSRYSEMRARNISSQTTALCLPVWSVCHLIRASQSMNWLIKS
jgi:hypothetical protein